VVEVIGGSEVWLKTGNNLGKVKWNSSRVGYLGMRRRRMLHLRRLMASFVCRSSLLVLDRLGEREGGREGGREEEREGGREGGTVKLREGGGEREREREGERGNNRDKDRESERARERERERESERESEREIEMCGWVENGFGHEHI